MSIFQKMFDELKRDVQAAQKRLDEQTNALQKLSKSNREKNQFDKLDRGGSVLHKSHRPKVDSTWANY